MRITLKLFATLTDYLPPQARRENQITLDVAEGSAVAQVVQPFGLPAKLVHLVLVNGAYVPPEERHSRVLREGDVLAIWPPVAGG